MHPLQKLLIAAITVGATVSGASAAVLTIDDFETYTNNQDLATSAASTPWRRFGQVNDDFYAKTGAAMDGVLGGQIPVAVTGTGQAILQKSYVAAPLNPSSYATATVLSKSLSTTGTNAGLQLSVTDGNTTYMSTVAQAETLAATTYTFGLTTADLAVNGGTESLATVLSAVTYVGFRISSPTGAAATETLAFDDFRAQTATGTPEPASLGLLGLGVTALAARRRR